MDRYYRGSNDVPNLHGHHDEGERPVCARALEGGNRPDQYPLPFPNSEGGGGGGKEVVPGGLAGGRDPFNGIYVDSLRGKP